MIILFDQLEELNKFNLLNSNSFSSVSVPAIIYNQPISSVQLNRCKICLKSFDYVASLNFSYD